MHENIIFKKPARDYVTHATVQELYTPVFNLYGIVMYAGLPIYYKENDYQLPYLNLANMRPMII